LIITHINHHKNNNIENGKNEQNRIYVNN